MTAQLKVVPVPPPEVRPVSDETNGSRGSVSRSELTEIVRRIDGNLETLQRSLSDTVTRREFDALRGSVDSNTRHLGQLHGVLDAQRAREERREGVEQERRKAEAEHFQHEQLGLTRKQFWVGVSAIVAGLLGTLLYIAATVHTAHP